MSIYSRRQFIKTVGATTLTGPLFTCDRRIQQPPNVVFIFSDQQHWHALGFKDAFFDTPHQDAFAGQSVVFDNAFCTTPQCSPSRSSIFTGLYPHKTGVMGNIGAAGGDPLQQTTLAKPLHEHGYKTAYVGKWHLGDRDIARRDFDYFLAKDKSRGQRSDPLTTKDAVALLKNRDFTSSPFALFVSYIDPHDIYSFRNHDLIQPADIPLPESWSAQDFESVPSVHRQFMIEDQGAAIWGAEKERWQQYRACYRAKVKEYDDHFGAVIKAVEQAGLWGNTIIVNTSDHGDMDTHNHLIWKGPFMYEHMVRIPFMIRVPEAYKGVNNRRIDSVDVINVDFAPTLLELCGLELPATDGLSLKPILTNQTDTLSRDYVISEYYSKQKWVNPIRMIRTPDYKYNLYIQHGEELYDLKNDPEETHNLAMDSSFSKKKKELASELKNRIEINSDPFFALHSTDRQGKPF